MIVGLSIALVLCVIYILIISRSSCKECHKHLPSICATCYVNLEEELDSLKQQKKSEPQVQSITFYYSQTKPGGTCLCHHSSEEHASTGYYPCNICRCDYFEKDYDEDPFV